SPLNLAEDDLSLGNLNFVPKGEINEVFGMKIPKELITDNIRNVYLEMVAKHDKKIAAKEGGKKKATSKADKSKKPASSKQSKSTPA
nr:histone deacetylase 14 [Tanacetum cinerariifolium]